MEGFPCQPPLPPQRKRPPPRKIFFRSRAPITLSFTSVTPSGRRIFTRLRLDSRAWLIQHRKPARASVSKPYSMSMDRNLLHVSFESGMLEDPWFDATGSQARDMYKLSVSPEDAPNEPEYVELHFESGNCISVAQVANLRSPENGGTRAVASQTLGAADRTTARMTAL